jgi:sugar fermentation stimulation protein A
MPAQHRSFVFDSPLVEGLIVKRRNRFIMEVAVDGAVTDCHCPTTGSIGTIVMRNIPCLLSKSRDVSRKTPYTVEAISVDLPSKKNKSWIGINQNAANRYVEHYLSAGRFSAMVGNVDTVLREQKLGSSKLDFLVGDTYLEVKTPLTKLQVELQGHIELKKAVEFTSFDRFVKHINELAASLGKSKRAILLNCFIYDNPGYQVPARHKHSDYIKKAVQSSIKRGISIWQVNFIITPTEVKLARLFETTADFMDGGKALKG